MTEPRAPRGRPQDPQVTDAILHTALRILGEHGYAAMSVEAVAKAAGVGKTAIYRRFTGKADLAAAAMAQLRRVEDSVDTGSARGDLVVHVERSLAAMVHGPGLVMIGTLLVEGRRTPELLEAFRERIIHPLYAQGREALLRGVERGEVRADADIDGSLEAILGQIITRYFSGRGYDASFAEHAVDVVWDGLAPPRRRNTRP